MNERFFTLHERNYQTAYAIHCSGHPAPWSESVFSSCLSGNYFAVGLQSGEHLLGYFIGLQVVDELTLMDIAICPESRGQGYGKTLLAEFLEQCISRKAATIWLEVRASNHPAIALYRSNGFELIETRKQYYQRGGEFEDGLVMRRTLAL